MDVTADPLSFLRERTSMKWRSFPADVLPLFVAESDFPLAEPIRDALTAAVRRSDTGYVAPVNGLGAAFAGFAGRRWGWQVDPEQVTTTTDVSAAIVETLRMLIRPGDRVVITPPVYPPFSDLVPEAGGVPHAVPLLAGQTGWTLDLDGLERAFRSGVRCVLLCNPHNPIGHPHTVQDLTALSELAAHYGVTVVSDEVHAPLTYTDAAFTPYLTVSTEAADHGVCVTSASKAWNLAGLKCALLVTAGERMRAELAALLDAQLPGVGYRQPGAGYLAWLDLRSLGWGDDPALVALEQARVALSPGPMFGEPGRGFARLNFGCSPEVLAEAVSRLAAAA
ncbi:aminotransferase class I/II-fold pyridoxal phosphate-dependent enzyme [Cryobacterium sp. TMT2-17-1]|uniref:MalY/PatB family protein n=1 Tax=Cryobacterium sp. TMT2-17-1 TaxID=1259248 RepID=UPI001068F3D3|nr:aminotransferase class I/II-fold pyridoxal phosphate-dependent enzyme [Cryobacterium sp. TMT2-17-1]TFC50464.1 aminotransferase class I/II-fold pyridoxal phosphate-dependent enzyme [Cryobacterium sp. TMT2-17-1]